MPFNNATLRVLADGPRTAAELHRRAGAPARTTMRGHLRLLLESGLVRKLPEAKPRRTTVVELLDPGRQLLIPMDILSEWLGQAPHGAIELGTMEAKGAVKTLVDAWSSGMIRALAARPLSLTELDGVIVPLSYPALERRLTAMRVLGMVEAVPVPGRNTPYKVTDWLRRAIGPLTAATDWERSNRGDEAPATTKHDVEAAFMLTLPIVGLPGGGSGTYRLAVQSASGSDTRLVGVTGEVRDGSVVSCTTGIRGTFDTSVTGSLGAWLAALLSRDLSELELGGRPTLGRRMIEGMHRALLAG